MSTGATADARRALGGAGHDVVGCWDAGDMGCGELVIELRRRLTPLAPGARFELVAHDPGAPEDLPSWCRLTGHELVTAAHPVYLIQRRLKE